MSWCRAIYRWSSLGRAVALMQGTSIIADDEAHSDRGGGLGRGNVIMLLLVLGLTLIA
jgi:hypothetical protein